MPTTTITKTLNGYLSKNAAKIETTLTLAKVADTGSYNDLTDKPTFTGSGGTYSSSTYSFVQTISADVWVIVHNLDRFPQVTIIIGGQQCEADVQYIDNNTIRIDFSKNHIGEVYVN